MLGPNAGVRGSRWLGGALLALLLILGGRGIGAARFVDATEAQAGDGLLIDADGMRFERHPAPVTLVPIGAPSAAASVQGLSQNTPIAEIDFEDATFPPEGWEVDDQLTIATNPDPVDTWSRQICNTDAASGGMAAAWVAGGGSNGLNLACGQNIGKAISTRLYRDEIDTTNYPYGVQVDFRLWLDLPQGSQSFNVCWRESGSTQVGDCYYINPTPQQQKQWLGLQNPLLFAAAANKPSIEVMFWFNDRNGSGSYAGGFIDNVVVEGVIEPPPPTATPQVSPTPAVPTQPGPSATPTITPTPTERAKIAFLPLLAANADKNDPEHFRQQYVEVWFGTAIDPSDRVENMGTQFQYGHMRLCAQVNWFGWPANTEVRWQWYQKSGSRFEEIQSATLNDTVITGQESRPYASRCIRAVDGEGKDVPIWMNEYKVDVFVNGESSAAVSEIALVSEDPPPGATALPPTPTPWPTGVASPTPTPGATSGPPIEPGCSQVVENGDFERGPSVGWSLATNVQPPNNTPARVILRGADLGVQAFGGEWLAVMGRAPNVRDQLISATFDFPDASQIISATLDFSFGIVTEETKDGSHDDTVIAAFVPKDGGDASQIPGTAFSEELIDANAWYSLSQPIDVTQLVTARAGWSGAQLLFQSVNDAEAASAHLLDEIELVICVGDGSSPLRGRPALQSSPSLRTLSVDATDFVPASQLRRGARFEPFGTRLR